MNYEFNGLQWIFYNSFIVKVNNFMILYLKISARTSYITKFYLTFK